MAKINARGATEVARINATLTSSVTGHTGEFVFLLRSDAVILRKFKGGAFKVYSRAKKNVAPDPKAWLTQVITARGYEVTP